MAHEQARNSFKVRWLDRCLNHYIDSFFIARSDEGGLIGYLAGCLENPMLNSNAARVVGSPAISFTDGDELLARDAAQRLRRFGFSLEVQKIEHVRTSVLPKKN